MASNTPAVSKSKADQPQGGLVRTYKPGQGFWTRIGTAIGAGVIGLFLVYFLYQKLPAWTPLSRDGWPLYTLLAGLALTMLLIGWLLMNRPKHAEFLIETDAEMKKVAWPTWHELIGSTKVVIIFMFLIAAVLFMYDVIFGVGMFTIGVNKINPFG